MRLSNSTTEKTPVCANGYVPVGKYERGENIPSIEVARKLAVILNTTVGYLLGETDQENALKDPDMLRRLNDIENMDKEEKEHVLFTLDALIQKIKIKNIAFIINIDYYFKSAVEFCSY